MQLKLFSELSNNSAENIDFKGKTVGFILNGSFQFESLSIYGEAFKTYNLRVYPNFLQKNNYFIDNSIPNEIISEGAYFYYFPLKLYECDYGQILLVVCKIFVI